MSNFECWGGGVSQPSLLSRMIGPQGIKPYSVDNLYTHFLDRNPEFFTFVLDHLLIIGETSAVFLPNDITILKNIARAPPP